MKKISSDIRTTYEIELTAMDFVKVATGSFNFMIENEEFKSFTEDSSLGDIEKFMEDFPFAPKHGNDLSAIAYEMGFDGWSRGGTYCKRNRTYRMEVYNRGADSI